MARILAIDPSGTGTTGICLIENNRYSFADYQDRDWKNHWEFIRSLASEADLLLFETTNYINSRGSDMTSLLKLMGAIESLPIRTESLLVSQVKDLKSQVFKKTKQIPNLIFKPSQGWFYKEQRISLHQLDAFLVYWLWKEKHA